MTGHEFVLRLNREVTDNEIEALYEAGCSDAAVETGPLGTVVDFTRDAPSLAEALVSAVRDIEKVQGLRAVGVECDNMVTLAQIADRAGVSREAVRLWSTGQRRRGGFPAPEFMTPAGEKIWDWQAVADWMLLEHNPAAEFMRIYTVSMRTRTLCTAHRVLAARAALEAEPDEIREELETLLQDA
jgi:hypothetical protein